MSRPVFFPYKMKSGSAKLLSQAFEAERVYEDGAFRNNFKRPIINWGNSNTPEWMKRWDDQVVLNHPSKIENASNKLKTFELFKKHKVKHPEWTTKEVEAAHWLDEEHMVVVRKTLTGKGGEGLFILKEGDDTIFAPLYTKYFKKKNEYRVHVMNGKVIDFSMKKKRTDVEDVNYQVRNLDNGWVFCREGVELPKCVAEESIKAVKALGLDFGAVDVGYNVSKDEPCVFEVNTAPGIEGTTLEKYVAAFKEVLQ